MVKKYRGIDSDLVQELFQFWLMGVPLDLNHKPCPAIYPSPRNILKGIDALFVDKIFFHRKLDQFRANYKF